MDRHQLQNAIEKVDGYHVPRPNEPGAAAFERAKAETLDQLRRQVAAIESLTHEQFRSRGKRG